MATLNIMHRAEMNPDRWTFNMPARVHSRSVPLHEGGGGEYIPEPCGNVYQFRRYPAVVLYLVVTSCFGILGWVLNYFKTLLGWGFSRYARRGPVGGP